MAGALLFLDTLAVMTTASVEACDLDERELMLAASPRSSAVGGSRPPGTWSTSAPRRCGITLEDVRGLLITVAPIVGTARVMSAAGNLARALGFAMETDGDRGRARRRRRLTPCGMTRPISRPMRPLVTIPRPGAGHVPEDHSARLRLSAPRCLLVLLMFSLFACGSSS